MIEIKTEVEGSVFVIIVVGEIDASSSIHLDNALEEAIHKSDSILVNLTGLEYISSAGLGVFISRLEDLESQKKEMVLFGLNDNVYQVFSILGLGNVISIVATKEEGINQLNGGE